MNFIPENIIFIVGLIFRILFYSFFFSIMFFQKARNIKPLFVKQINFVILFFAICYIGSLIPMLFDGKVYEGVPVILFIWSVFFIYLYIINNHLKLNFNLNKTTSNLVIFFVVLIILYCNAQFNYHSYRGTWYADYFSEKIHGILSFLLPLFAYLFTNIKPKGFNFGVFIILATITHFAFGISLSYGVDGYLSDDLGLSLIFILNTIIFLVVGLKNIIYRKKGITQNAKRTPVGNKV